MESLANGQIDPRSAVVRTIMGGTQQEALMAARDAVRSGLITMGDADAMISQRDAMEQQQAVSGQANFQEQAPSSLAFR